MADRGVRGVLEALEGTADVVDVRPALAFVAGRSIAFDEDELHGATRRALLLLAAGGDPQRGLDVDGRAVGSVAADLEGGERAAALTSSLGALRGEAEGLPTVAAALDALAVDPDLAWRAFACALLADALGDDA